MPLPLSRRGLLAGAVLAATATVAHAALPGPNPPPSADSLTGQLLVAMPEIGDPRFYKTVILLVQHGADGAIGIIVNRPLGEWPWGRLLAETGQDGVGVTGNARVFFGGPVARSHGFVLHSAEYRRAGTVQIDGRVAMTSRPEVLADIARHVGPRKSLIAFGYAGWAAGQLEHEMALHGWFTIADDPKLVFDDDRAKVWDEAMARRTIAL